MQLNVQDLSLYQLKEIDFALEEYIFKELGDEPFSPTYRKNPKEFRKLIRELVAFKRDVMAVFSKMYEHRYGLINFGHIQADQYDNYFYSGMWDYYDKEMAKVIEKHTKKTYTLGILALLLALGIATNLTAEDAQGSLLKHALKTAQGINKTTKNRIITQIKTSVSLNEDRTAFEERLKKVLNNQYRGYLISENEGLQAFVNAQHDVALDANLQFKTWEGVQSDSGEICGQVIGQTVGIDENFSNGLAQPLAHIRCRCSLSYSNSK